MRAILLVLVAVAAVLAVAVVFWHPSAGAQPALPGPVGDAVSGGGAEEGAAAAEALPEEPPPEPLLTSEMLDPGSWPGLGQRLLESFLLWVPSLLAALLVLVAFFVFNRVLAGVLRRVMARTTPTPRRRPSRCGSPDTPSSAWAW